MASSSEGGAPAAGREVRIGRELDGERVDRGLARALGISRAAVRRLLDDEALSLRAFAGAAAGAARALTLADKGRPLAAGDVVAVRGAAAPDEQRALAAPELALAVLARGPGWIAVDKPAGLPVHPLRPRERATALGFVASLRPEVHGVGERGLRSGVVHRLDVDTSGALLFATEQRTWERLRSAFARGDVEKRYRALVAGRVERAETQRFRVAVVRHRPALVRARPLLASAREPDDAPRAGTHVAVQRLEPIACFGDASLVEIRPKTGFLHQIRATLACLGHPVLGDATYGDAATAARAARQLLHAAYVRFEEVEAIAPDPADLAAAIERLQAGGGDGAR